MLTAAVVCVPAAAAEDVCGQSGNFLRVGAAKVDITPQKPVLLAGYGSRKDLSTGVHDNLYARAFAFENRGKKLVLVTMDLISAYENLQQIIMGQFGLERSQVFLTAIHTHSGPIYEKTQLDKLRWMQKKRFHANNSEYAGILKGKLLEVVAQALDSMKAAGVGVGRGYSPVGMNRRMTQADGSVTLGCNPYGPTDKEVLVLKITAGDGGLMGAVYDYACHATSLGPQNLRISGDLHGITEQFVEKIIGEGSIAAALVGASGDIDPWFRICPTFNTQPGWVPEPILQATMLGEEVVRVLREVKQTSGGCEIKSSFVTMQLPGKKRGQAIKKGRWPATPLNITAARIGNTAFVGFGCELLTETGMTIKAGSPYEHTFVITHCNGEMGYLPPRHLYKEKGYEVESSRFAPDAADMVVKQALKMLYELY